MLWLISCEQKDGMDFVDLIKFFNYLSIITNSFPNDGKNYDTAVDFLLQLRSIEVFFFFCFLLLFFINILNFILGYN